MADHLSLTTRQELGFLESLELDMNYWGLGRGTQLSVLRRIGWSLGH